MNDDGWQPWHGPAIILAGLVVIAFFFSVRGPKDLPESVSHIQMPNPLDTQLNLWKALYEGLGGIPVSAEMASAEVQRYRERTGIVQPPVPTPEVTAVPPQQPVQEQPTVPMLSTAVPEIQPLPPVRSYPPETYASSAEFVDARFTGFEQMHWGFAYDEGLGVQCVAGAKYFMLSALGLPIKRDDGGNLPFAPSQPRPGYPYVALEDFRARYQWENTPETERNPYPPDYSIAPPVGVATIDGRQIEYYIEIIESPDQLQRGDMVVLGIHIGMFSAYTADGRLQLFDQNGGRAGESQAFAHHAFPRDNFNGALRVVYHL